MDVVIRETSSQISAQKVSTIPKKVPPRVLNASSSPSLKSKMVLRKWNCNICYTEEAPQPVELPCCHVICLTCLRKIVELSALTCPYCRYRLSVWLRRNKDYEKLVIEVPKEKYFGRPRGRPRLNKKAKLVKKTDSTYPRHRVYRKPKVLNYDDPQSLIENDRIFARRLAREQEKEFYRSWRFRTRSMKKSEH